MLETKIDLKKTALLVIDMQNDLVKDKTGLFSGIYSMVQKNRVIENIAKVITAARNAGIPIVHVKTIHREDGADMAPTITDFMLEGLMPPPEEMPPRMVEGTVGADFIDELKPAPGDYVIEKRRSSAFYGTDLELILRTRGVDTLLVTGVVTSGCVENTVRSARDLDFHVIVLSDCCADMMEESHNYSMKNTFRRTGRVRTSDEVIAAMKG